MVLITQQGSHTGGQNSNFFLQNFHDKKRVQFPVKDYWFCFCPKVWTPWPQLKTSYTGLITVWPWCWWPFFFQTGFYRTLREVILTVFFLIICRWNLFRTICANSRKVGLGKFLSPYKDIDLSRIPVDKGTNLRLRWKKYGDLYEIVHLSLILISLCLFTGV